LGGVDKTEQFLHLETLRNFARQFLQHHSSFIQFARVIQRDCSLEFPVERMTLPLHDEGQSNARHHQEKTARKKD